MDISVVQNLRVTQKSSSSWFSHQNSKYPSNLELGVKVNLEGYRYWVPMWWRNRVEWDCERKRKKYPA